jgi:hypothetical protein
VARAVVRALALRAVHERDVIVQLPGADRVLELRLMSALQFRRVADFKDDTASLARRAEGLFILRAGGDFDRGGAALCGCQCCPCV